MCKTGCRALTGWIVARVPRSEFPCRCESYVLGFLERQSQHASLMHAERSSGDAKWTGWRSVTAWEACLQITASRRRIRSESGVSCRERLGGFSVRRIRVTHWE